jgi:hypothetical protein
MRPISPGIFHLFLRHELMEASVGHNGQRMLPVTRLEVQLEAELETVWLSSKAI